jgi:DNA-binding response OmpR family regulator
MRGRLAVTRLATIAALFQLKQAKGSADIDARWAGRNMRILGAAMSDIVIYEEDFQTCTLLKEWLGEAGYNVRIGNRCEPQSDAHGDLVIVSVCSPKQAGSRSTRDIRSAHAGTPMIAISGQFRPGLAATGTTAQFLQVRQVVAKPLVRKELLESVRGILDT